MRQCGDCQLCCKLVPVPPLNKKAGERCRHQRHHKGCAVYHRPGMPPECALWNCRWLINNDTYGLPRPDRAHYVIDIAPDFITMQPNDGAPDQHVEVVQIWVDPSYPTAHRDPALRRYLRRRADQGIAALIRFNEREAMTLFWANGEWHEVDGGMASIGRTHTMTEIAEALGEVQIAVTE